MKRVPTARLRLCLRCAVSWTGVARGSSVKEKNLGESCRAKKKNWLLSMNYQNLREAKLSRPGPDYTREAPGIVYEGLIIKPISCMCGGTPDLSNRVRGLDDLSFFLVGEAV